MFLRILKRDLKRKKTMNMILFLFIVLATMFVASGINNVVTVMNGTDYYLDKAGVGDFIIVTMGDNAVGALDEMLKTEPAVLDYRMECVVYGSQEDVTTKDGLALESKNNIFIQSVEESQITFFDKENRPVTDVEQGHVYVSGNFLEVNGLEEGDIVCLNHSGVKMSFIIDGTAKDALLGSDFMGNTRFILSDEDMRVLLDNEVIKKHYRGEVCYIDTDDVGAMSSAMTKVSNIAFEGSRSLIKMCYVMDMIVAFLMLILSICLIIVSFVVLKFSITFTIAEEFREIGVMKAIGLSNGKIRRLYIIKYLVMALMGAGLGFFASIPFGRLLLHAVSKKMVLGNDNEVLFNLLGALLVVLVIVLFAYLCTGKVKKFSPVDAIRSGQTGERYKNRSALRLCKFPADNELFMACNDVLSNPKRFVTIIISFSLCVLFVLMLVNTITTIKSPSLIHTFGTESHLYMTNVSDVMSFIGRGSKEYVEKRLEEMGKQLGDEGMPAELCIEVQYKYPVTFEGNAYVFTCQQGLGTTTAEYVYTEGAIPENKYEIAITPQIAEITGAAIGDTMTVHFGGEDLECMVTAYFQTMNQMGELIRLHEDAPTDFGYISSAMSYQINFTDEPSEKEIELRKERVKDIYQNDKVMNATEYCIDCIAVVDTLEGVRLLLLGITLVVVILVTVLMERSFIADEKSQIAILKAVGFRDSAVIRWHVYRLGLASLIAVILAAVLALPVTKLCITPIFGMMGAADVNFNIDFIQVFLLYPGVILMMTVLVSWITALYTKTIKSSDTANIE